MQPVTTISTQVVNHGDSRTAIRRRTQTTRRTTSTMSQAPVADNRGMLPVFVHMSSPTVVDQITKLNKAASARAASALDRPSQTALAAGPSAAHPCTPARMKSAIGVRQRAYEVRGLFTSESPVGGPWPSGCLAVRYTCTLIQPRFVPFSSHSVSNQRKRSDSARHFAARSFTARFTRLISLIFFLHCQPLANS